MITHGNTRRRPSKSGLITHARLVIWVIYFMSCDAHSALAQSQALAQTQASTPPAQGATHQLRMYTSFMPHLSFSSLIPQDKVIVRNGKMVGLDTPTFSRYGLGASLLVGVAWRNIALETGLRVTDDLAKGCAQTYECRLEQATGHIPISMRGEIILGRFSLSLLGGVDWVIPLDLEFIKPPMTFYEAEVSITQADPYLAINMGGEIGYFLESGPTEFFFRFTTLYTPDTSINSNERGASDQSQERISFYSQWKLQLLFSVGVSNTFSTW